MSNRLSKLQVCLDPELISESQDDPRDTSLLSGCWSGNPEIPKGRVMRILTWEYQLKMITMVLLTIFIIFTTMTHLHRHLHHHLLHSLPSSLPPHPWPIFISIFSSVLSIHQSATYPLPNWNLCLGCSWRAVQCRKALCEFFF